MESPRKKSLTPESLFGTPELQGREAGNVDESGDKQWSKRISWANCREPYKTELDTLGSHWIEGALSNEELAFEAVQFLSELDWSRQLRSDPTTGRLDDVILQVKILTEAMLSASLHPNITPELRREALNFMRTEMGKDDSIERE